MTQSRYENHWPNAAEDRWSKKPLVWCRVNNEDTSRIIAINDTLGYACIYGRQFARPSLLGDSLRSLPLSVTSAFTPEAIQKGTPESTTAI